MKEKILEIIEIWISPLKETPKGNRIIMAEELNELFTSELSAYKELCAAYKVLLGRKNDHTLHCWVKQNWDEALDAMNDTPMIYRDQSWCEAMDDINHKMRTCSCGLNDLIAELSRLQDEVDINTPFFGNSGAKVPTEPTLSQPSDDITCKNCKYNFLYWSKKPCIDCQKGEFWAPGDSAKV